MVKPVFAIVVFAVFSFMLTINIIFPAGATNSDALACSECGKIAKEKTQNCFEKEGSTVKCNILYHQELSECDLICRTP